MQDALGDAVAFRLPAASRCSRGFVGGTQCVTPLAVRAERER
jgi:hypothetical protein